MAKFVLTAFADEISPDLSEQVRTLKDLHLGYLDLRSVDGTNVKDLTDQEVALIRKYLDQNRLRVACIGSPVGKSPIDGSLQDALADLDRVIEIGKALGTNRIRIFSFYPPDTSTNARYDEYVDQAIHRLERFIPLAERKDTILLLENEKQIVGDTIPRCYRLVRSLVGKHFRFLWDPANFVQVGEHKATEDAWDILGSEVGYVHIKDALLADGSVVAAGEGQGQVRELLACLNTAGYEGFLALEPHLERAGKDGGFSGPEKMAYAVRALRGLMASIGIKEEQTI
jgi:sugar phosphate isomerase/epimerase